MDMWAEEINVLVKDRWEESLHDEWPVSNLLSMAKGKTAQSALATFVLFRTEDFAFCFLILLCSARIMWCLSQLQVLLLFQAKEKENHSASQMTLEEGRPWGITYLFICYLVTSHLS